MTVQPYAQAMAQPDGQSPAQVWQQASATASSVQAQVGGQGLSFMVHAPPKHGKSTFADSGPRPRLILDIEGASRWTPSRKKYWNPMRESPPQPGSRLTAGYGQPSVTPAWESAIVITTDADVIDHVYRVLASGQHPFNSASFDSITEGQQRWIDKMVGSKPMLRDNWGELLRRVTHATRAWRDLVVHPARPLWSLTFVAGTHWDQRTGKFRPLVQGQSADYLPYYVDILGHIFALPDGSRRLYIGPHPQYETGERVGGRLPFDLPLEYPGRPGWSAETMVQHVLTQ